MAGAHRQPDTRYGGEPLYPQIAGFDFDDCPCANGLFYLVGQNRQKAIDDVLSLKPLIKKAHKHERHIPLKKIINIPKTSLITVRQLKNEPGDWYTPMPVRLRFQSTEYQDFDLESWVDEYVKSDDKHRKTMKDNLIAVADSPLRISYSIGYFPDGKIGKAEISISTDNKSYFIDLAAIDLKTGKPGGKLRLNRVHVNHQSEAKPHDLYRAPRPWLGKTRENLLSIPEFAGLEVHIKDSGQVSLKNRPRVTAKYKKSKKKSHGGSYKNFVTESQSVNGKALQELYEDEAVAEESS